MAPKKPQDHKRPADRLRDEAIKIPGLSEMAGLDLTVKGRNGEVTVTTLDNPMDWDAEVLAFLNNGDYLSAICGMLTDQDAKLLVAVKPSIGSLMEALMEPAEESSEPSPGEPQAS